MFPRTRPKGRGAHYSDKIRRLSDTHRQILEVLSEHGPLTKVDITKIINEQARASGKSYMGGFSISGRLSELLGLGLISMRYSEVRLYDSETMTFRFRKKPVWSLTGKGVAILKNEEVRTVV